MENKNTVSIPLVDILSEMLNERVVMSGDDYVVFSTLKKIEKSKIDEALIIKAEKERVLSVPTQITKRQAALYLESISLYDDLLVLLESNRLTKIEWDCAANIFRSSPLINSLGQAFNLTPIQIDNMFVKASTL
ncbi:hypothetical protein [Aliarcobacter cibarius]|uniref:Uncharacterized protein n=1 Tax=Aliarcobacter cibarius TaxID=255507 RepID=A0ABY2V4R8_9BACT|nr:hypothetical protein [Aliarcobacter cibarius]TLS96178.1 hypothetical protein FE245_10775 [Aliarcobacter cibarius]TLS99950.1 hypothetical protein FE247_05305 [Aliarcobacter cibarius]